MTRKHLRWVLILVVAIYSMALLLALWLRSPLSSDDSSYYRTYKDILPLIIAIPAAYLAFAFQRRGSYLQALRSLWSQLVGAISAALVYTETENPTKDQYLAALMKLSLAIEEVRGVFLNVPNEAEADGWYPFEPVKQIRQLILDLGHGEAATPEKRAAVNLKIYKMWKSSRNQLLAEFDREIPTHQHAEYAYPDAPTITPAGME
jgi:hypothetical protein